MRDLKEKLKKESYFQSFYNARMNDEIAEQIRYLRLSRGFTQQELAKKSGMKQSAVSRLEQANYNGWCVNTLNELCAALDARVVIKFIPREDELATHE